MSIEVMSVVLNHSRARGASKLVLIGIANHVNPDNDGAWPSQARLAQYANVSDRAVRDAIENLVYLGELRYEVGTGLSANQYKPNRYWVTLTCPPECDGSPAHRVRVEVSNNQGGSFRQSGWKQASDKPLEEPLEEPTLVQAELGQAFTEFWELYPRREKKAKAEAAFYKWAKEVGTEVILAGARRYRDDPNREKPFTRIPESWLNGNCWEDDPLPNREPSKEALAEKQKEDAQRRAERERLANLKLLEELKAREAEAKAKPPTVCEHDRVIHVCRFCSRKSLPSDN